MFVWSWNTQVQLVTDQKQIFQQLKTETEILITAYPLSEDTLECMIKQSSLSLSSGVKKRTSEMGSGTAMHKLKVRNQHCWALTG